MRNSENLSAIYGNDNRKDIFEITNQAILNNADSIVALFQSEDIIDKGNGTSTLVTKNIMERYNLCPDEKFRNQPIGAFCSGFLVAPNIIATSGHCVDSDNVHRVRFVFGFRMLNARTPLTVINNSDIFQGMRIIERSLENSRADWALVEIDRNVTNHRFVQLRRSGKIADGQSLYVIGHPLGLPLKYADGATIRDNAPADVFIANLDTYAGNSGSPVFNSITHDVEGILVRGERDFVEEGNCLSSMTCLDTGCRGEDCTRATEFADKVPF